MEMNLIFAAPPNDLARALSYPVSIAHMAYQIGANFELYRANIPLALKGGLMLLGDSAEAASTGDPEALATQVVRECISRGYDGVILGFQNTSAALHSFAAILSNRLRRQGALLFLPEAFAADSDWAKVLISTAISGGSLKTRLEEVCAIYGSERICLDIERVRMDFCLPSESGQGTKLSAQDLYTLQQAHLPHSYFSQDLCAYYFTYQDKAGSHFVLYDDAGSIRKKLFLAKHLGIDHSLLLFPEVEDICPSLDLPEA